MSKNKDLNKVAQELFKAYPGENKVIVTSDGQGFFNKNRALNHASKNKLEYQEFFREGHEIEADSALEDLLIASEEKVREQDALLEQIQDAANVEAEDVPEIPEDAPEALKMVVELRTKHIMAVGQLAEALGAVESYNELVASLATLVKGDTTKLGKEIIKLLPVKPEA